MCARLFEELEPCPDEVFLALFFLCGSRDAACRAKARAIMQASFHRKKFALIADPTKLCKEFIRQAITRNIEPSHSAFRSIVDALQFLYGSFRATAKSRHSFIQNTLLACLHQGDASLYSYCRTALATINILKYIHIKDADAFMICSELQKHISVFAEPPALSDFELVKLYFLLHSRRIYLDKHPPPVEDVPLLGDSEFSRAELISMISAMAGGASYADFPSTKNKLG